MSAGVGAAFSFVLVNALTRFFSDNSVERSHELLAIFLVSVAVINFLDPAFEHLRGALRIEEHHSAPRRVRLDWRLRAGATVILVFASFFHGLLHNEIEFNLQSNVANASVAESVPAANSVSRGPVKTPPANRDNAKITAFLERLLAGFLVPAAITYFWISAAHRRPSHAARSGLISGFVVTFLVLYFVLAIHPLVVVPNPGLWVSRPIQQMRQNPKMLFAALRWPLLGLIGGWAIDRGWGRKVWRLGFAILVPAILFGVAVKVSGYHLPGFKLMSHLATAVGWAAALIGCSRSAEFAVAGPEETGNSLHQLKGAF